MPAQRRRTPAAALGATLGTTLATTFATLTLLAGPWLAPAPAVAQAPFPNKPVKIIIGFPAGGPLDAHARLLAERLGQQLGQPIIVDYKAGAGGTVGADFVAKSDADGYTLLLANTGTMVINPAIYPKNPYQTLRDFVPVARTAMQPLAFVVNPNVPAQTMAEFIALAKKQPGRLNYGSAGNGGISHLVPEMFKAATGTFIVHIPYRGSAPAFTDLLAGQVQMMAESIPQASQYVKQGKLRALAVTSRERSNALPDTPTLIEVGLKGFDVVGFYGILAPVGTPKPVVDRLSAAFKATLETPEIRTRMVAQGADPAYLGPDDFAKYLAAEMPKWAQAVKDSGAKLD
jgi:tripartite-type tricarboxylate transporter receptor subunit TctC